MHNQNYQQSDRCLKKLDSSISHVYKSVSNDVTDILNESFLPQISNKLRTRTNAIKNIFLPFYQERDSIGKLILEKDDLKNKDKTCHGLLRSLSKSQKKMSLLKPTKKTESVRLNDEVEPRLQDISKEYLDAYQLFNSFEQDASQQKNDKFEQYFKKNYVKLQDQNKKLPIIPRKSLINVIYILNNQQKPQKKQTSDCCEGESFIDYEKFKLFKPKAPDCIFSRPIYSNKIKNQIQQIQPNKSIKQIVKQGIQEEPSQKQYFFKNKQNQEFYYEKVKEKVFHSKLPIKLLPDYTGFPQTFERSLIKLKDKFKELRSKCDNIG